MIGIIDAELICNQCGQKIKMKHLKCQKKKRVRLISKFLDDWREIMEWGKDLPKDSEIIIRLKRKEMKWEKMIKK